MSPSQTAQLARRPAQDAGPRRPAPVELVEWAHPARMADYLLGGSHNFAADRAAADELLRVAPHAAHSARANRAFGGRVVRHLRGQGIRQFLDLGSGLPTAGSTHEVAQALDPTVRVVYVDNDPTAAEFSWRLLGGDNRHTGMVYADLRDPESVFASVEAGRLLRLSEPIAVLALSVLHFLPDDDDPAAVLRAYRRELAPGSFVALSHLTDDASADQVPATVAAYDATTTPVTARSADRIAAMLEGVDLVAPGLVAVSDWRTDLFDEPAPAPDLLGAVGRLPVPGRP